MDEALAGRCDRISICIHPDESVSIEDNGVGIKKENLGKIFEDYSRLDEHEEMNAKGTGLGMNICKRIIGQMGGKCSIDSEVGLGTEVTIDMQLKATDKLLEIKNHKSMKQEQIDSLLESIGV